jgi:hypothetical protein
MFPSQDPLEAGLTPTLVGDPINGNTCPGSIEVTVPFTTTGQKVQLANPINFPGALVTGSVLHMSLRVLPSSGNTDAGNLLSILGGPAFAGNIQPYYQGEFATPDGDVPRDDAGAGQSYGTSNFNAGFTWAAIDAGGWNMVNVPIVTADGGPSTIYLNQIGVIMYTDPNPTDAGFVPLSSPVTVMVSVDDIWVQ